jgi:hypothetical protein
MAPTWIKFVVEFIRRYGIGGISVGNQEDAMKTELFIYYHSQ